MALPAADLTKVHLDAASDDPQQARLELEACIDKVNALINALGALAELGVGAGLSINGTNLDNDHSAIVLTSQDTTVNKVVSNKNGYNWETRWINIQAFPNANEISVGTGFALLSMPFAKTLVSVQAIVATAGTGSGVTTIDINKNGSSVLTTKLTIDDTETTSETAAIAAVIDGTADDFALNDVLTIDIDGLGTGDAAKGLAVRLEFR